MVAVIKAVEDRARGRAVGDRAREEAVGDRAREQREEQLLLVVARQLRGDLVAQVRLQYAPRVVPQERVLADGAREHALVHAYEEERLERDAPGRAGVHDLDALHGLP